MATVGPISAVSAPANALTGVKRPLQSNPTRVPSNRPAFRGTPNVVGSAIKAPKLNASNRPNRGTNVTFPYARVVPYDGRVDEMGRTAPGDLLFIKKRPPGFLSQHYPGLLPTPAGATLTEAIGLDGLNKMLHGLTHPDGWVLGVNCFEADAANLYTPRSPFLIDEDAILNRERGTGTALMSVLEEYTLDGVVITSDREEASHVGNAGDNVVFNVAIQGRAEVSNGYLGYDLKQTVEAYPRGGIESQLNSTMAMFGNSYHYMESQARTFPVQMFDRQPSMLDSWYVGLRVYKMANNFRKVYDTLGNEKTPANGKAFYFCQYIPFSGRKANHIRRVSELKLSLIHI